MSARRDIIVPGPHDLAPDKLTQPIERAASGLSDVLDAWDELGPLVKRFLKETGIEITKGLDSGFDVEVSMGPGITVKKVTYLNQQGKEVTKDVWLQQTAHNLVTWVEKLTRSLAAMTKATDEAARLRSFLTGGPDSRPDLESMSDKELIDVLINVAVARGLAPIIQKRATEVLSNV